MSDLDDLVLVLCLQLPPTGETGERVLQPRRPVANETWQLAELTSCSCCEVRCCERLCTSTWASLVTMSPCAARLAASSCDKMRLASEPKLLALSFNAEASASALSRFCSCTCCWCSFFLSMSTCAPRASCQSLEAQDTGASMAPAGPHTHGRMLHMLPGSGGRKHLPESTTWRPTLLTHACSSAPDRRVIPPNPARKMHRRVRIPLTCEPHNDMRGCMQHTYHYIHYNNGYSNVIACATQPIHHNTIACKAYGLALQSATPSERIRACKQQDQTRKLTLIVVREKMHAFSSTYMYTCV